MTKVLARDEIKEVLFHFMKEKLAIPTIDSFSEQARLNEDLYLDSIMILQLILHLEIDLGITIPDEMLVPKDFHTVSTLMDFIERLQQQAVLEESYD